jgi:Zn-finger nucleic acid-binding protein
MNVPEAMHCSGCGRKLGLEPLGKPDDLKCPDCQRPFEAFCGGPGLLHDCPKCGGQFVEHALVRELIERHETYGSVAPRHPERSNPLQRPVRYVRCPACDAMMNRKNFAGSSGVVVDECRRHGLWFEPGELPRVLAFVESGGLARARREKERPPPPPPSALSTLGSRDELVSTSDLLTEVGRFLADLFRRS